MIRNVTIFDWSIPSPSYFVPATEGPIAPDGNGVKWALFDFDGWNAAPDVRTVIFDKPNADGAVLDAFHYAPRTMELRGGLVAPSRDIAVQAIRRLKAAFSLRDGNYSSTALKNLPVEEYANNWANQLYFMSVKRAGKIEVKPAQLGIAYEWSVPLIAPDPLKYAAAQHYVDKPNAGSGPLVATDSGTAPSFPELYVTGPITDAVITHDRTGWFIKINGTIPAGQIVYLNNRDHGVGGYFGRSALSPSSRWLPVMPGVNNYTLTGSGLSGATRLEAYWFDAYD